jgi:hypothetical protein
MRRTNRRGLAGASLFLALTGCAEAGTPGIDGADGAYAESSLWCSAIVDGLLFEYQVVDYSNGDVWVSCSVGDNLAESGESSFYLAGQTGAAIAACAVTYDYSGELTEGWWAFTIGSDGIAGATYDDPGDLNDGDYFEYGSADCTLVER